VQQPHQFQTQQGQRHQQDPEWYAAKEETFEGRLKGELKLNEIEVDLNRLNYKRKFNNLICWEERRHIEVLRDK
jgi:hypothetical protein